MLTTGFEALVTNLEERLLIQGPFGEALAPDLSFDFAKDKISGKVDMNILINALMEATPSDPSKAAAYWQSIGGAVMSIGRNTGGDSNFTPSPKYPHTPRYTGISSYAWRFYAALPEAVFPLSFATDDGKMVYFNAAGHACPIQLDSTCCTTQQGEINCTGVLESARAIIE
jgi:hypothetical protein